MSPEARNLLVYLRIKLYVIPIVSAGLLLEYFLGIIDIATLISGSGGIIILLLSSAGIRWAIEKRAGVALLSHPFLTLDLIVIIFTLYFSGGTENMWWFIPAVLIFVAGYIFTLPAALYYALLSSLGLALDFFLEYKGVIPHIPVHTLPAAIHTNLRFLTDYAIGMFLLYWSSAMASGFISQAIRSQTQRLEKSLYETEWSKKVLSNVMDDLNRTKDELEIKIKGRTAELEKARADLENKVNQRTADLDDARKAIMHMMKDLREDFDKLRVVDRMKTEFLSLSSHELRTPLTPIKGYLALLLGGKMGDLTGPQKRALDVIEKQTDHLHALIDNILDLSRIEQGKEIPVVKTPISLKNVIKDMAEAMKIQAEDKQIKITPELGEGLPTIMGDVTKLRRVLVNLVGNALKFTPWEGEVTIRALAEPGQVRVEVADNGLGLAPENLEKIFEKFYQVDSSMTRAAGGMGMGLTIARELVELHGGKIWAESPGLGQGSRFIFTLPLTY